MYYGGKVRRYYFVYIIAHKIMNKLHNNKICYMQSHEQINSYIQEVTDYNMLLITHNCNQSWINKW